jgi:hypothetical protein
MQQQADLSHYCTLIYVYICTPISKVKQDVVAREIKLAFVPHPVVYYELVEGFLQQSLHVFDLL